MTPTKIRSTEADTAAAADAARARLTEAVDRVAALESERNALSLRVHGVRREIERARKYGQVRQEAEAEAELAAMVERDTEIRQRDHPHALDEVGAARRELDRARNPILASEEAAERLAAAEAHLAELRSERDGIPAALRRAALEGDVAGQVALGQRSDELPLLVAAAEMKLITARRHYGEAMAAAAEPGSLEASRWAEVARQARIMGAEMAEAAAAAARGRAAPVVRSAWQGSGVGS